MARSNMSIEPAWALMNGVNGARVDDVRGRRAHSAELAYGEVDEHTALNSHMARRKAPVKNGGAPVSGCALRRGWLQRLQAMSRPQSSHITALGACGMSS